MAKKKGLLATLVGGASKSRSKSRAKSKSRSAVSKARAPKSNTSTKKPSAKPTAKKSSGASKSSIAKKTEKRSFPNKFPFWARLKISKNRTTLVIDEAQAYNKKLKKDEDGFVHREAIHTKRKSYEEIKPNPDKNDPEPMYLKPPRKLPKRMFRPHEKDLDMPKHLQERYETNNKDK